MHSDKSKVVEDSQRIRLDFPTQLTAEHWSTEASNLADESWNSDGAVPFAVITLEPTKDFLQDTVAVSLGLSEYSAERHAHITPSLGSLWDGKAVGGHRHQGLREALRDSVRDLKDTMDIYQAESESTHLEQPNSETSRQGSTPSWFFSAQIMCDTIMAFAPILEGTVRSFLEDPESNFEMSQINSQLEGSEKPINHSDLFRFVSFKTAKALAWHPQVEEVYTHGLWRVDDGKVETHDVRTPDESTVQIPYASDCLLTLFEGVKWDSCEQN
ncbi:hypothetical protein JCM24511_01210 [Saitozyma sp. JCM 24511]|nr:hypothetical protein JCM24511_01210 [Saitozyma sp. JCM 24511]